jgi:hypothetical protein
MQENTFEFFLQKGFDINIKNSQGQGLLFLAIAQGKLDVAKELLQLKATVDLQTHLLLVGLQQFKKDPTQIDRVLKTLPQAQRDQMKEAIMKMDEEQLQTIHHTCFKPVQQNMHAPVIFFTALFPILDLINFKREWTKQKQLEAMATHIDILSKQPATISDLDPLFGTQRPLILANKQEDQNQKIEHLKEQSFVSGIRSFCTDYCIDVKNKPQQHKLLFSSILPSLLFFAGCKAKLFR